ncbi:MAG: RNase adapter RapZ [Johnsonella sp.]|nr:RNase adapter RapZ [Johnsonella sp.]
MRFIIVTGMSGSGKTVTLKLLEDHGYYCVDNLPIDLIVKFFELLSSSPMGARGAAIGIDIRSGRRLKDIEGVFRRLDEKRISYEVLYLDADSRSLIKRYKETRRRHPLAKGERLEIGIEKERQELEFLKERADYVLDTSRFLAKELKQELAEIFCKAQNEKKLFVNILSFGFSYGIPSDADLLFDVRFLPNPFYEEKLKLMTGKDAEVRRYVFSDPSSAVFLEKLKDLISYLIPLYIKEGKSQLVIGIGCTGGQHRSVLIAGELGESLKHIEDIEVKTEDRDMEKNLIRIR